MFYFTCNHALIRCTHTRAQMTLFYVWLNTYFISSSMSEPLSGCSAGRLSSDQWYPVPSRSGARRDGSDLGMRCFVSMVNVGEADGSDGRCITVSLPRTELDRIGHPTVNDLVKPGFTVRHQLLSRDYNCDSTTI